MKHRVWPLIVGSIFFCLVLFYELYIFYDKYGIHLIGKIENGSKYISENGNYSILLPGGWRINEVLTSFSFNEYLTTTFSTIDPRVFVNVQKIYNYYNTPDELLFYELNKNLGIEGVDVFFESADLIGLNEGRFLEFTFVGRNLGVKTKFHCYDWIVTSGEKYVFTFCSSDKKWEYASPMFLELIKSIEIIE